ncbi:MAG TPA: hypothetical protein DHV22_16915 [Xanthomarina gelatinilytica]|uniref:Uncharacterized protein n=1 Tax=Xanthomarina gelatinilytica TaxID=1137281 RepID=A0A3D6BV65_9FLAO|nr:hypothetical protein [Xanthomarina gelatinilytica]
MSNQIKTIISPEILIKLGFTHQYDSEIENQGTPDEFSYSVYVLKINDMYLDCTIEKSADLSPRKQVFLFNDLELNGRTITIKDIQLVKEIL